MCSLFLSYIPHNFYYAPIKTWLQVLCFLIVYECMLNRKNASNIEINGQIVTDFHSIGFNLAYKQYFI